VVDMTDTDALNRFLAGESDTFFTPPRSNQPALAKVEGAGHPICTRVAELRRGAGSRRLMHVGFAVSLAVGGGLGLAVILPGVHPTVPSLTAPPVGERPERAMTPDLARSAGKTDTVPIAPPPSIAGPDGEGTARVAMARWYGQRRPPADRTRIDSAVPYTAPHRPRSHRRGAPPSRGLDALPTDNFGCPASLGAACAARRN
jgi:hypothetical protein